MKQAPIVASIKIGLQHLIVLQDKLLNGELSEDLKITLERKITALYKRPMLTVTSDLTLHETQSVLKKENREFALVQDSQNMIHGIVRRKAIEYNLPASKDRPITSVMDRHIAIESDSASIFEVIDRLIEGEYDCALIVDAKGRPGFIVTPGVIMWYMSEKFPTLFEDPQLDQAVNY